MKHEKGFDRNKQNTKTRSLKEPKNNLADYNVGKHWLIMESNVDGESVNFKKYWWSKSKGKMKERSIFFLNGWLIFTATTKVPKVSICLDEPCPDAQTVEGDPGTLWRAPFVRKNGRKGLS